MLPVSARKDTACSYAGTPGPEKRLWPWREPAPDGASPAMTPAISPSVVATGWLLATVTSFACENPEFCFFPNSQIGPLLHEPLANLRSRFRRKIFLN